MLKAVRRRATPAVQDAGVEVEGRETHGPTAPSTDQGPGSVSDPRDTTSTSTRQPRRPVVQNADIPPIAFPGGRNPYLDRPLPPPPPPKTTSNSASTAVAVPVAVTIVPPVMLVRPSTSSGPSSKSAAGTRPNFDKRQSKDDMALNGRVGMAPKGKGLQPYIIGIKGSGPLTPESSPGKMQALSPAPNFSVPSRVMTPESILSGEIPIGMALGSPSQVASPYDKSWNGSSQNIGYQALVEANVQRSPSPPPVQKMPEPTMQRSKTQKRRLFGSLFGRKHAEPAKTMEAAEANQSTVSITVTSPAEDNAPTRSKTVSGKKAPKHRPIVIRSNTLKETSSQQDLRRTEEQLNSLQPLPGSSPARAPGLLDFEIPDVRLERYSIMFSGVLNPNGTSPQSKSSLLERRQATLEKLKTINDQEEEERIRPRRATSPQPMKSPGFTLFPQAMSSTNSLAPPPRKLTRSNTSPALLPSPARAKFDIKQEGSPEQSGARKERKTVKIVSPRAMDEINRAAQVEKLREQQQAAEQAQRNQPRQPPTITMTTGSASNGFYFGPNNSALILDSPASFVTTSSLADEDYDPKPATQATIVPLRPAVPEPQWQMISPPSSTTSSSASDNSSKQSVASSVTTRPSLDTLRSLDQQPKVPPVQEDDVALKAAVEISIARQISISRQQRNMLRPLGQGATMSSSAKSGMIRGRSATGGGGATTAAVAGSQITVEVVKRRVQETRLAVPTLVVADNRKSELVEVVDA
ncbi:hypothetical protein B0T21DRAFT_289716 [Apiosordaria backusii]|uniref:Uncharacterized protein n=1 Tax=Apiosordaria backusii TaxID=314023 RepID=A0AA40BKC0_9PEZI|nr:hypothetical protein B0T21DRAFT_289716 [Apiosordaria backusii]